MTLLYILGTGHCGSTLLSLLLNGHSRMLGMSALRKIDNLVGGPSAGPQAVNGSAAENGQANPLDGELWRRVKVRYEAISGQPFERLSIHHPSWKKFRLWNRARIQKWAGPLVTLLRCIAEESGRDILVDSSKSWQQLYLVKRSGLVPVKVLHALRDGRAVLHSYNRKYHDFGFSFGQWAKPTFMAAALRPMFADQDWRSVHYEELASEPERTLRDVCSFVGAEFEPAMLRYRSHPWFGILGNRMAHGASEEIRLDEKWRRELARRDRVLFDLLGGPLNRYFGYRAFPPSLRPRRPS